jgi:hypothetical protein
LTRQVGDIAEALAYQLKKEVAENYFGTRKALEEEREELIRQIQDLEENWKKEIVPILGKIYEFFIGEKEGQAFLSLIRREDLLDLIKKVIRKQENHPPAVSCSVPFALRAIKKYRGVIVSLYHQVKMKEADLLEKFNSWKKKVLLFNEDLAKFESSYNLSDILSLAGNLESDDGQKGVLGENTDPRSVPLLEKKLILRPLVYSVEKITLFRSLPALDEIKKPLEDLIDQTFEDYGGKIKKILKAGL